MTVLHQILAERANKEWIRLNWCSEADYIWVRNAFLAWEPEAIDVGYFDAAGDGFNYVFYFFVVK